MIHVHAKLGKLQTKKGRGTIIHSVVVILQEPCSLLLFSFHMYSYEL